MNEQNDTPKRSGGKLMETTINTNKYKGNAGHVRKAEQEHASGCRRLKRNGRGERREAREDRKGTGGRKERTRQSGTLKWQMFTIPELYELC